MVSTPRCARVVPFLRCCGRRDERLGAGSPSPVTAKARSLLRPPGVRGLWCTKCTANGAEPCGDVVATVVRVSGDARCPKCSADAAPSCVRLSRAISADKTEAAESHICENGTEENLPEGR